MGWWGCGILVEEMLLGLFRSGVCKMHFLLHVLFRPTQSHHWPCSYGQNSSPRRAAVQIIHRMPSTRHSRFICCSAWGERVETDWQFSRPAPVNTICVLSMDLLSISWEFFSLKSKNVVLLSEKKSAGTLIGKDCFSSHICHSNYIKSV